MNWNHLIRTIHRWTSITFVVAVVTYIVAAGHKELAFALGLFALVPLIVLIVTGLYMFFQPRVARWRGLTGRRPPAPGGPAPGSVPSGTR
jgi:hypothetical protein